MLDYGTSSSTSYFHQDHVGTVVALSDATGHLTAKYTYSPHGEVGSEGVEGSIWRYTGRQLDAETGLYYYRARYYSAQLGRFLQIDPVGDKDSPNLYQYALWDPINKKDVNGREVVLATHNVFLGWDHSKIVVIPNNQSAYANNPDFGRTLPDGRHYATLGAGPQNEMNLLNPGSLVSNVDRPRDMNEGSNKFSATLTHPDIASGNATEDQIIAKLFQNDKNYKDNEKYGFFPKSGDDSYNSNGYAAGLLRASGFTNVPTPQMLRALKNRCRLRSLVDGTQKKDGILTTARKIPCVVNRQKAY